MNPAATSPRRSRTIITRPARSPDTEAAKQPISPIIQSGIATRAPAPGHIGPKGIFSDDIAAIDATDIKPITIRIESGAAIATSDEPSIAGRMIQAIAHIGLIAIAWIPQHPARIGSDIAATTQT